MRLKSIPTSYLPAATVKLAAAAQAMYRECEGSYLQSSHRGHPRL